MINRAHHFSSRIGFIASAAGSAIGLGNIWKFPYIVGIHGGGVFICVYLAFLALVGFPAFFAEVFIGKTTQQRPAEAFAQLGRTSVWRWIGFGTIVTGFLISTFYGVVAGWVLGYFVEAVRGTLNDLTTLSLAQTHAAALFGSGGWCVGWHVVFAAICYAILLGGVKGGLERCNKIAMPLFGVILIGLAIWAMNLPTAGATWQFLSHWGDLPRAGVIVALGHAFFTLSIGQGTLVTYGSYMQPKGRVMGTGIIVILSDTIVSLLAAFLVMSCVAIAGSDRTAGPTLIFETLPTIFAGIPGGHLIGALFFALVLLAALTSQISALEPMIAHIELKARLPRRRATFLVVGSSLLLGIPSALSLGALEACNFATTSILVPLGGLAAVLLVGWVWRPELPRYLNATIRYLAPLLILGVLLHAIGVV